MKLVALFSIAAALPVVLGVAVPGEPQVDDTNTEARQCSLGALRCAPGGQDIEQCRGPGAPDWKFYERCTDYCETTRINPGSIVARCEPGPAGSPLMTPPHGVVEREVSDRTVSTGLDVPSVLANNAQPCRYGIDDRRCSRNGAVVEQCNPHGLWSISQKCIRRGCCLVDENGPACRCAGDAPPKSEVESRNADKEAMAREIAAPTTGPIAQDCVSCGAESHTCMSNPHEPGECSKICHQNDCLRCGICPGEKTKRTDTAVSSEKLFPRQGYSNPKDLNCNLCEVNFLYCLQDDYTKDADCNHLACGPENGYRRCAHCYRCGGEDMPIPVQVPPPNQKAAVEKRDSGSCDLSCYDDLAHCWGYKHSWDLCKPDVCHGSCATNCVWCKAREPAPETIKRAVDTDQIDCPRDCAASYGLCLHKPNGTEKSCNLETCRSYCAKCKFCKELPHH